ncbi:MAG: HTTM domain-containing protein, partial [Myxococcales bacterium]|nr:HTTM domain-containing protein [Myxococcales bacterium]
MLTRLMRHLGEPICAASLAAYRFAFGVLMCGSALRFIEAGWVERCFVRPRFFFSYYGFSFVEVLSPEMMTAAFVTLAVLGALIAIGLFYRVAIIAYFLLFTYVELIDVTNYLNHYYLVSLLAFLLCFVPANAAFSLDAKLGITRASRTIPRWVLTILRFQVGCVYVFAALAKLESDFLVHAEPVQIWMAANSHVPIVGPYLARYDVALLLSWAGFLNDLFAVPLLLTRRTRPYAFVMIVTFHLATNVFFNIGIFPILMPINATLFLDPDWPFALMRRFGLTEPAESATPSKSVSPRLALLLGVYALVQITLPLRTHLYGGSVLWHEQGMRFSWRVMLRSKAGSITYRVRVPSTGREIEVSPRRYLTDQQEREFSGQPDLILALAHRIASDFRAEGHADVEVRADAWVSLNGRPAERMIDPDVDLARIEDGLA